MIGRPFSAIVDKKKTGFKEDAMIRKGKKEDIDRIEEIYSKLLTALLSCAFNGIPNVQLVCLEKVLEYD